MKSLLWQYIATKTSVMSWHVLLKIHIAKYICKKTKKARFLNRAFLLQNNQQ